MKLELRHFESEFERLVTFLNRQEYFARFKEILQQQIGVPIINLKAE